ncbi:MAG TPA: LytTR family DNA-binding domain-containing protein [Tenuifilaceae bacterium]|nr:LytTR family DNA-binding domain-containing protein [Tenuifilaceae bacterium]
MKLIIVEDEQPARDLLKHYLAFDETIEIIGEYADGFSGALAINRDKPDIVLLDIQLPKLNGFELLELLDVSPQIIFTTAYDEYAIKAFELNATDYLLKPFSKERFSQALQRAKEKAIVRNDKHQEENVSVKAIANEMPLNRVVVKDSKGIHIIAMNDIFYIEAQDDYIMIYCTQGRYMKKQTMKSIEQRLNPMQFVRVHRSYIANVLEIDKLEPYEKDSYIATIKNGETIKVSASGYKLLREQLDF